nr:branched-chain amino acid ABC transporter permease [Alphaproteobacteria bacterium]
MNERMRSILLFAAMTLVLAIVGFVQSWSLALAIVNLCLISAVMSLGVNIQWGYAGLFNVGVMGFAALGGVTGVLISTPPVMAAWQAGGNGIIVSFFAALATILAAIFVIKKMPAGNLKRLVFIAVVIAGYFLTRNFFDPAVENIEAVEPAKTGFLGGVGLPIIFSWIAGGILAAGAAWVVGKIALGLRSDYLAIATLG